MLSIHSKLLFMWKKPFFFILSLTITNLVVQPINLSKQSHYISPQTFETFKAELNKYYIQNQLDTNELVYTPNGPVRKSQVHYVDSEHHLNITDSSIQIVYTKTGAIDQEFKKNNNLSININNTTNSNSNSVYESGYITSASWQDQNINPITYFSTSWLVPLPPKKNDGQIIYLFEGLTEGWDIIQPVLQWGFSPAGGLYSWSITNWYVQPFGGIFYGPLIKVNPGDTINCIIKLISRSINSCNYTCSFTTNSTNYTLQVNNSPELNTAWEALEGYWIFNGSDYPPENKIRMKDIIVKTDSISPNLNWCINNQNYLFGEHSEIISNCSYGDEIDIYFHGNDISQVLPSHIDISSYNDINIKPNPTNGLIHISFHQPIVNDCKIEIYNNSGCLLQTPVQMDINNELIVDLQNYPTGLYLIRISNNQKTFISKIIKN